MFTRQLRRIVPNLVVGMSAAISAQSDSSAPPTTYTQARSASSLPIATGPSKVSDYSFSDGKQQFRNYLFGTFGPPGLISSAIGAALEQNKPAPPEWDSGAKGYGERYGSRFGMQLVSQTSAYSMGALVHEGVTYHRCHCRALLLAPHMQWSLPDSQNQRRSNDSLLSELISPHVGSFTVVNAWYPSRYEPAYAFRLGSTLFLFKVVGNLVREFLAPRC